MGQIAWNEYRGHLLRQQLRLRKKIDDVASGHNPADIMVKLVQELRWCEKAAEKINQEIKKGQK